ncbi:Acyl dehydratase [Hydrocarboniphaga daqingensis]|uniref:Acyl dehydratase n=1 Tax=Hydrocarboniphaga daqingensis TaxID=490188 RepID=A0A1M5QE19_9GAMM|nr:MaoC family dehydratase [Hydrocarboniphaga daqingensis]SHH11979.1 Acyl dehydratase [Hydrocarboniphaga daqingensis]
MSKPVFASTESLLAAVGSTLGTSDWLTIEQSRIDLFADATDDHQWIHVDAERAKSGPFGATIAHGYLTLSLMSYFLPQLLEVQMKMGVNYGCDKVRFPNAVRVGSRVRGHGQLIAAEATKDGGVQATIRVTVEIEGQDRPACVADTISRYYF